MDEVELVEEDGTPAGPGDPARRDDPRSAAHRARARRLARRWWPVPLLVVAALVGTQVVQQVRTDALADRLRQVDGVLGATVAPPFDVARWGDAGSWGVGPGSVTTPDGAYVGLVQDGVDDPWVVSATDARTGVERWRVPVGEVPPATGSGWGLSCLAEQEPVQAVWCEVARSSTDPDQAPVSRLTRVDVTTHEVTASTLHEGDHSFTAGGGLLVRATAAEGVVTLRATRGPDRTPAWTAEVPAPGGGVPWMRVVDGYLLLQTEGASRAYALADGRALAEGGWVDVSRDGALFRSDDSNGTRLLGSDGTGTLDVEGVPVVPVLDDRSEPDVLLLHRLVGAGDGVLVGADPTTGAVRWEQPDLLSRAEPTLLLDGVLYGAAPREMWAVDVATGDLRWRTASGSAPTEMMLTTDGVQVMRVETDPDGGTVLAAYRLRDGVRAWAEPLPDGVTWVQADAGVLFGAGDTGLVTLG